MAPITLHVRSIRPNSGSIILGVGTGSGTTLDGLFKLGTASAQALDVRARADGDTGTDARILYARLHQYGTGGGEAVRAYAFAQNAATATGGTLNGLHASVSIATSSAISGQASGARITLEAAAASRTLGGTLAALNVDSNIGTGNTMPTNHSFIRFTNTGAVALSHLLQLPSAPSNGTIFAAHTTQAMTHSLRVIGPTGTAYYIMVTDAATNRS